MSNSNFLTVVNGIPTLDPVEQATVVLPVSGTVNAGDVVYVTAAGAVAQADADNPAAVPPVGVAQAIVGSDALVYLAGATVTSLSGLTAGVAYWLSTTPGALTSTKPGSNAYIIGVALSATDLVVSCVPATLDGGGGGASSLQAAYQGGNSITTTSGFGSVTFSLDSATAFDVTGSAPVVNLANTGTAAQIRFLEPSASGTNYTAFQAQAQSGDVVYTLPAADGTAQQTLATNGSGSLAWQNTPEPLVYLNMGIR